MISSLKITTALIRRKRPEFEFRAYHDTPVTPLSRPLSECKLALITTAGLHLKDDRPFDLETKDGDCSYRVIPGNAAREDIAISHRWYNHKFINSDLNCVLPIDRMREYAEHGTIGAVSGEHYSFMGHIYDTKPLEKSSQALAEHMRNAGVDIAFLTPA